MKICSRENRVVKDILNSKYENWTKLYDMNLSKYDLCTKI